MSQPLVKVLAVIGTGLIGCSFAAALRRVGQVGKVLGVGRTKASLERAQGLGFIDEIATVQQAGAQADLILLATPVRAMGPILQQLAGVIAADTIITDAGSTKLDVAQLARQNLGDAYLQFIPGHPIAGSEMAGPEAADPMLYHGRKLVLTPFDDTPGVALHRLIRIWEACGAQVRIMSATEHDQVLASVSHLPHLLASAYMHQVIRSPNADLRLGLAGTGFRDFSRIAAGSAEVWRDIFLSNRAAVLHELDQFLEDLQQMRQALAAERGQELEQMLEHAALARRFWAGRNQF